LKEIGHVQETKNRPNGRRHHAALFIVKDTRMGEMYGSAQVGQLASVLCEHVLDPLGFFSIRQRDDEIRTTPKNENWRAVQPVGFPARVYNDAHSWKIPC
jgi:hypothetical protein